MGRRGDGDIRKAEWMKNWNRLTEGAAELLYPSRCPICQKIEPGICRECSMLLKLVQQPCCCQCGKPVDMPEQELCPDCSKDQHVFSKGFGMLLYEGKVKDAIHRIKYQNKREYVKTFAELLARYGQRKIDLWKPEVLIPIPMYEKKQRERGYNQAELLARHLGNCWDLPVDTQILKKICDTDAQKELDRTMRRRNLRKAFEANTEKQYQRVMLVDDVYTTGSTIDAAAAALKKTGISEIFFAVICIGHGDMVY